MPSSTMVTKWVFVLTTKAKTTERPEPSPKNTKIFTTNAQQSDNKHINVHM